MRGLITFALVVIVFSASLVGALSYASNQDRADYAWSEIGEQKIHVEWARPYIHITYGDSTYSYPISHVEVGVLKATYYDDYDRFICYTTPTGGVWINVDLVKWFERQ